MNHIHVQKNVFFLILFCRKKQPNISYVMHIHRYKTIGTVVTGVFLECFSELRYMSPLHLIPLIPHLRPSFKNKLCFTCSFIFSVHNLFEPENII